MSGIKRADWVVCRSMPDGPVGIVRRVAKDGSWADVNWRTHVKRMRTEHLLVKTTLSLGGGITVEDMTRADELAAPSGGKE